MQLEDRYYTSTEVAEILGVSLRSVYRYMEDNKLIAEVKTATGRHRFTRKNITDFLYPDGAASPLLSSDSTPRQSAPVATQQNVVQSPFSNSNNTVQAPVVEDKVEEEPQVDWLAKFREAATKYKEDQTVQPVPEEEQAPAMQEVVPQPIPQPVMPPVQPEPLMQPQPVQQPAYVEQPQPVQQPAYVEQPQPVQQQAPVAQPVMPQPVQPVAYAQPAPVAQPAPSTAPSLMYYRSMLGGLKDIAQNLDKSARNSNLEYAFTLNAGASLHKPIKPFATLHAYVKSQDRDFYEKILRLTPSNHSNAQLCLVVSDNAAIYSGRAEVHGLFVVSADQLKSDISSFGDAQLAQEMADVL